MNLLNVDLNLLKVLHALIEERNVTRAGVRIGRGQPAMSNAGLCPAKYRQAANTELAAKEKM